MDGGGNVGRISGGTKTDNGDDGVEEAPRRMQQSIFASNSRNKSYNIQETSKTCNINWFGLCVCGDGCLVVILKSTRSKQLNKACAKMSWNRLFIQRFAQMLIVEDATYTINKNRVIMKKVGKVFETSHDVLEEGICSRSVRAVLL